MMRKKLVAGNWKMNKDWNEAMTLLAELADEASKNSWENTDVLVAPPFLYLRHFKEFLANARSSILLAAQNCAAAANGAYTGEVSAEMLRTTGCSHVIIGHSERRQFFGDSDAVIADKVQRALEQKLVAILCCGEQLEDREAGRETDIVSSQIQSALDGVAPEQLKYVVLAYEPVWAIGTGKTASPEQAQTMHAFLRSLIGEKYGEAAAADMRILYGGSCKAENAGELFSQPDIDGGLIGGAALQLEGFCKVISAADSVS